APPRNSRVVVTNGQLAVGTQKRFIPGCLSDWGAKSASQLPAHRLRPWDTDMDFASPVGAGVDSEEGEEAAPVHSLLRIVRPLAGDAADLSLATREPSTLQVSIGTLVFHDHPLFSREDKAAVDLRNLYDSYWRLM